MQDEDPTLPLNSHLRLPITPSPHLQPRPLGCPPAALRPLVYQQGLPLTHPLKAFPLPPPTFPLSIPSKHSLSFPPPHLFLVYLLQYPSPFPPLQNLLSTTTPSLPPFLTPPHFSLPLPTSLLIRPRTSPPSVTASGIDIYTTRSIKRLRQGGGGSISDHCARLPPPPPQNAKSRFRRRTG